MKDHFVVAHYAPPGRAPRWKVDIRSHFAGKRIRRFFETEAEAWAEGVRLTEKIQTKGTSSIEDETGGMSVAVAVRLWMREAEGKSKSHSDKIIKMGEMINARFRGPISAIEPYGVQNWLKSMTGSETSKAGFFRYARMFFRWARGARFIADNPMDGARSPRATPLRNVLTTEQMLAFLDSDMPDDIRALMLLGGFAGLRTIEVARMNWEDIQPQQIHVRADVSKQHEGMLERIVDMTEPLQKRASFFADKKGRIVKGSLEALYERRRKVALRLGWNGWPDNALRHSFATYHLARCGNAGLTAYQMGHTDTKMVLRVYAVPAKMADWEKWWAI